jgi:phage/plasmid primase-like uncharacterized protein
MTTINYGDAERQFVEAMRKRALALSHDLIADGNFHRCDAANKANWSGKNDGAYVLHLDGVPRGAFCNYTDGYGWNKWVYKTMRLLTVEQRRDFDREIEAKKIKDEAEREAKYARGQELARRRWNSAQACEQHAYLDKKRVLSYGLRVDDEGTLLIPMLGRDKKICSLQTIDGDGQKLFLTNGRAAGSYFRIGKSKGDDGSTICIAEGYATGATVHEATGHGVFVAFCDWNLTAVAEMVRERYPDAHIVICADDDWKTEGNPGLASARKAARAVDGKVAVPAFGDDRADELAVIMAKAQFEGDEREVYLRIAGHHGRVYIDLADKHWRVVEIDADGWRLVRNPPVRFYRRMGMLALPVPAKGGKVETLKKYVNLKEPSDFVMAVAWILGALRERGPYPVLNATGEAGAAKSTFVRIMRSLVDPNVSAVRTMPRNEQDLFIAANNGYVLAFDNLSWLPEWLSDGLSRIATEGSFATRMLYTDDEERLFTAMRPILLNGVEDVVVKGDLADRMIALELQIIPDKQRRREREFWKAFEADRAQIFGALLGAVAHGLRQLPEIHLEALPRMADFTEWAVACGDGLLRSKGAFVTAYAENRSKVTTTVVEGSPLMSAVQQLMVSEDGNWEGTMRDLKWRLDTIAGDTEIMRKHWPGSASALSRRIRTITTHLRRLGIEISERREGKARTRIVIITQTRKMPSVPSAPSSTQAMPPQKRLQNNEFYEADEADEADGILHTSLFSSEMASAPRPTTAPPPTPRVRERASPQNSVRPVRPVRRQIPWAERTDKDRFTRSASPHKDRRYDR